jgi:DNA-binding CsgD family transcriptional regulator
VPKGEAKLPVAHEATTCELSPGELRALELASNGIGCRETGELLGFSETRAKKLRVGAMNKLGADNTTQAVAMAIRRGMLP